MKKYIISIGAILFLILLTFIVFRSTILDSSRKIIANLNPTPAPKVLSKLSIIHILNSSSEVPIAVAIKNKYFEKYGLEVKVIKATNTNSASKSLISGNVDIALTLPSSYLLAAAKGGKTKYIGKVNNNIPFVFITSKNLSDIKIVGTTGNTSEAYFRSLEFLKASKMDIKKITFIDLGTTDAMAKALAAGRIDAASFTELVWAMFKDKNNISDSFKIVAKATGDNYLVKPAVMIVTEDTLTKKKNLIESFAKAILEANYWISSNSKEKITETIANVNKISKDTAPYYALYSKDALAGAKFTPDLKEAEALRRELESTSPDIKGYDVKNFVSFGISDSLKKQGLLSKYGF